MEISQNLVAFSEYMNFELQEHLETFVCDLKYVFFAHNKKIGKIHDDQFLEYNRMLLNSDK